PRKAAGARSSNRSATVWLRTLVLYIRRGRAQEVERGFVPGRRIESRRRRDSVARESPLRVLRRRYHGGEGIFVPASHVRDRRRDFGYRKRKRSRGLSRLARGIW